ncbi:plant intracellular Ras-group-related LRR protein 7 [Cryptomeria japonica]|uniref:plant intracellular Ras-group-related LRR protein 7 n=1 Tax=Cryptomeria japonica TaxID=3369 RepID=UPI0025AC878E|nr:plant intracellular Ras-group-related LRR protein 7 [Cryptomeria japonica]
MLWKFALDLDVGVSGEVLEGIIWVNLTMGCCMSKRSAANSRSAARWRSTGIVGLRDSNLKHFPSEVLELERAVRTLDMTHNKLVEIPLEIGSLANLQRLIVSENLLERLPITLGKLQSLKVLALDDNRLTTLPDELGLLVRLERLSVSSNSLISLPETIGSLRNLMQLNVSSNHLKFLPESIGSCFSLEELLANGNSIEDLPLSLCRLANLKSLSLSNNHISQLPQNLLSDCTSLQSILLHENPISMEQFQQMVGYQEFESRRKRKFDKQIDSNILMNSKGLDEGLDL